jgi:hypothetical protein
MPWTAWKADPMTDSAARDVLAAYDAAVRKGKAPVECYRAAIDAWFAPTRIKSVPMLHGRHWTSYSGPECICGCDGSTDQQPAGA